MAFASCSARSHAGLAVRGVGSLPARAPRAAWSVAVRQRPLVACAGSGEQHHWPGGELHAEHAEEEQAWQQREGAPLQQNGDAAWPEGQAVARSSAAAPLQRYCKVKFVVKYHVHFGQSLRIIGHGLSLGDWSLTGAPALAWGANDEWHVTVELPQSAVVEYKYVVLDSYGNATAWQTGNNNVLAVKHNQEELTVFDNWEGAPGASVASSGQTIPRQNQLLDWASEIDAVMSSTKNELRQARVELMSAKEEVRVVRGEVNHLRRQLAEAKVVEQRQSDEIKELKQQVFEQRSQLTERTESFATAWETAHSLLADLEFEMSGDDFGEDEDDLASTSRQQQQQQQQPQPLNGALREAEANGEAAPFNGHQPPRAFNGHAASLPEEAQQGTSVQFSTSGACGGEVGNGAGLEGSSRT